jgi:sugar/nucleoside kinase (ribokinase family)
MRSPALVTVGTVALDTIHTSRGTATEVLGGSASYFAIAASHHAGVGIVGAVGRDFPERHLALFRKRGIWTEGILRRDAPSFRWKGRYSEDLSRRETLEVHLQIFDGYEPIVPEGWRDAPTVFLANGDPQHQRSVLAQMRRPRLVVSDSMNLWIEHRRAEVEGVFRKSHGVTLNDEEARQFTGEHNLLKAAKRIRRLGPRFVIVKKGEHGCLLADAAGVTFVPAYPLEEFRDPTGAGDAFAGGLLGCLAEDAGESPWSLRRAALAGTVWGAFAVESLGPARLARATDADYRARLSALKKMLRNLQ